MKNPLLTWAVVLAACVPLLATAQAPKTEAPKSAQQLTYQSAFADYKPYADAPPGDWRDLNNKVAGGSGGASGHAAHGMEGMKGMAKSSAPAASASAPMQMKSKPMPMPMHDSHHGKGDKP